MARKTTGAKKVQATAAKPKRNVKPIRLDVTPGDYERASARAEDRGLTLASYARMALLDFIKRDEKQADD